MAAYEPKQPAESFVYRPQAMPATVIRTQNTTAPTQSQETFLNSSTAMGNFSDMTQKPVKNNDSFPALPIFPSDMGEPKQEPFTNEAFAQMANIRLDDIELPKMETVKEDIPDLLNKAGYVVLPEEVAKEKGVDLIALSATQIFIAQYDKHEGEWLADEESFNEEDPLWFSETDHRVSPVFQLKNKAALIREKVGADFHVRPVLFEQVGNIINAEDMMKTWNDLGVTVCRTASGGPVELPIAAEILKETTNTVADVVAPQGDAWGVIIYCLVVMGILYFFMIRPNKKRMAEYQKMLDSICVGNRVLVAGIYGTVKEIKEKTLEIEIAKGVVIEVNKNAVASVEK